MKATNKLGMMIERINEHSTINLSAKDYNELIRNSVKLAELLEELDNRLVPKLETYEGSKGTTKYVRFPIYKVGQMDRYLASGLVEILTNNPDMMRVIVEKGEHVYVSGSDALSTYYYRDEDRIDLLDYEEFKEAYEGMQDTIANEELEQLDVEDLKEDNYETVSRLLDEDNAMMDEIEKGLVK
jgi:hypothetical protein